MTASIDTCSIMVRRHRPLSFLLATVSLTAALAGAAQAQQAAPSAMPPQSATPSDQAQPASTATTESGQAAGTAQPDASAQDTAPDPAQDIVVTGYRRSIEKSLTQKREANAFVDVITAEDIGKFPDKNVADALQRVPGVVNRSTRSRFAITMARSICSTAAGSIATSSGSAPTSSASCRSPMARPTRK